MFLKTNLKPLFYKLIENQAAKEEESFDSYSFASSSSVSFSDGGSASANAADYDSSTDEVIEDSDEDE